MDGEKRVVEKLLSRRKLKRSYEYEVEWVGLHSDKNSWLSRDKCGSCPVRLACRVAGKLRAASWRLKACRASTVVTSCC